MKYYQTIVTTNFYCENCQQNPLYLSEVSNPASPRFDEPCCPYCGSTSVYEHSEEIEIFNLGEVMQRIFTLFENLDWDRDKRKAHLLSSCGKPALALLEECELLKFLEYLEFQT
jgi:protein-arginine kinase activator protein McsA